MSNFIEEVEKINNEIKKLKEVIKEKIPDAKSKLDQMRIYRPDLAKNWDEILNKDINVVLDINEDEIIEKIKELKNESENKK